MIRRSGDIDFEGFLEPRNGSVRFSGEQSEFFADLADLALILPAASDECIPEAERRLTFETPYRYGVSTRKRHWIVKAEDVKDAVILGEGVLVWPSAERQYDRYGCVSLKATPDEDSAHARLSVESVVGRQGRLIAEVTNTREPVHIGDQFRRFFPARPDVGELIELGNGTCVIGNYGDIHETDRTCEGAAPLVKLNEGLPGNEPVVVGCRPACDRRIDWLNPRALYRCHHQTVRLYFVPNES